MKKSDFNWEKFINEEKNNSVGAIYHKIPLEKAL